MQQIPRIILTHPSTSDEDVELLTQSPSTEQPHDFDILDRWIYFDNAFFPPWPRPHEALGPHSLKVFLLQHCSCLVFITMLRQVRLIRVIWQQGQFLDFIFVTDSTVSPLQLHGLGVRRTLLYSSNKVCDSVKYRKLNQNGCQLPLLHTAYVMDVLILCVYTLW